MQSIEFFSGGVASPQGFRVAATRAGIKTQGDDCALIVSDGPATAAAVFTQNAVKAAPVLISSAHSTSPTARAIVANAGNANCCTGEAGLVNANTMCDIVAREIGCDLNEVFVCSTGIIGHALPMEKLVPALESLARDIKHTDQLDAEAASEAAARAVMTTDTKPKWCAALATIGGRTVTVGGLAKGVGMIGPDMGPAQVSGPLHATMLSFLTTDAAVDKVLLQRTLEVAVARSFNSVTVDGDTSTNDSCILLASGASGVIVDESTVAEFEALLSAVCEELAKKVARDGEGATKLIAIEVQGARTEAEAKRIALSIANSPLVKTAIFGRDPNWGRIAMAAGKCGVPFDAAKLDITLGGVEVFRGGEPTNFDVKAAEATLQGEDVLIQVQLGEGDASWRAWTCDFSYGYVEINAEYHT